MWLRKRSLWRRSRGGPPAQQHEPEAGRALLNELQVHPDPPGLDDPGSPAGLRPFDAPVRDGHSDLRLPLGEELRDLLARLPAIPPAQHGVALLCADARAATAGLRSGGPPGRGLPRDRRRFGRRNRWIRGGASLGVLSEAKAREPDGGVRGHTPLPTSARPLVGRDGDERPSIRTVHRQRVA